MTVLHEVQRRGLDYLDAVTTLLQRVRAAHPTHGSYQAAEMQWWWTIQRSTDDLGQLFWYDDDGQPEAAVIATDWGDGSSSVYEATTLVPITLPGASPDWVAHVLKRGLAHAAASGIDAAELEVDRTDDVVLRVLREHGFDRKADGLIECWLDAAARPAVSTLSEGYRLASRADVPELPHHLVGRRRPDIDQRLDQLSLYRADLDLVVLDRDDAPAAYGLFWFDPVTATGIVEPMRTLDDHQGHGLARHVLTAGLDLLARAGAERIAICFEPGNPASGPLYRSVGFQPHRQNDVYAGSLH